MNFNNYLQKILLAKATGGQYQFGSLTGAKNTDVLNQFSLFQTASAEQLANLDLATLLASTNASEALGENATQDELSLAETVKAFMDIDEVQANADIDGNGEVTEEEAMQFLQSIMGNDGDATNFSMQDIDKAIENLGIDLADIAEQTVDDILKESETEEEKAIEEAEKAEKAEKAKEASEASQASAPSSSSGASGSSGGGGVSGAGNNSANAVKTKTAAETLEELEKQKQEIIQEADKNIQAKEEEKDQLVENDDKISDGLKKEYADAKKSLKETTDKKSDLESKRDGYNSDLSTVEQNINALEGEKSTLKTDTDDKDINSQNKSRLGEIEKELSAKKEKQADLEEKIKDAEQQIKDLEQKETEQQQKLTEVEAKIAKENPELGKKIEKVNGEIQDLKTQKASDVKDIDAQIQTKKAEANKEAKEAGENKGKAANDIGSGLVELASKYMGMNESDGSYKLFTNGRTEAWCADFVTYIVKEYANQQGLDIKSGFGSPSVSNLMDWAQKNGVFNNVTGMSSSERTAFLKSDLKPGDVIIWKSNGASHTGIIKSINDDGTFETIEGNSSDQVKSNHKSINDKSLTGFIKFSDIVT